jgi:hypothetical protein
MADPLSLELLGRFKDRRGRDMKIVVGFGFGFGLSFSFMNTELLLARRVVVEIYPILNTRQHTVQSWSW